MSRNYDHSKENLGEACGYTYDDAVSQRDRLLTIFGETKGASRIVEKVEAQFEKRELAVLLVGSIIATKKLEKVMELLQNLEGDDAIRTLMKKLESLEDLEEDLEEIG